MHPPRAAVAKDQADDLSADPVDRQPIAVIDFLKQHEAAAACKRLHALFELRRRFAGGAFHFGPARVVDQSSEIRQNVIEGAPGFIAYALCRKGAAGFIAYALCRKGADASI